MIRIKNNQIETAGDGLDLLAEAAIALTEVSRRMSEGDGTTATIFIATIVNTTITALADHDGIEVDKDMLLELIENDMNIDDETE